MTETGREMCKHCGLRIYQPTDAIVPGTWFHHGSNFQECHGGLDTCAQPSTPAVSATDETRAWLAMKRNSRVGITCWPPDTETVIRLLAAYAAHREQVVREQCAGIAIDHAEGSERLAEMCIVARDIQGRTMHRYDAHTARTVAAAIRSQK